MVLTWLKYIKQHNSSFAGTWVAITGRTIMNNWGLTAATSSTGTAGSGEHLPTPQCPSVKPLWLIPKLLEHISLCSKMSWKRLQFSLAQQFFIDTKSRHHEIWNCGSVELKSWHISFVLSLMLTVFSIFIPWKNAIRNVPWNLAENIEGWIYLIGEYYFWLNISIEGGSEKVLKKLKLIAHFGQGHHTSYTTEITLFLIIPFNTQFKKKMQCFFQGWSMTMFKLYKL